MPWLNQPIRGKLRSYPSHRPWVRLPNQAQPQSWRLPSSTLFQHHPPSAPLDRKVVREPAPKEELDQPEQNCIILYRKIHTSAAATRD